MHLEFKFRPILIIRSFVFLINIFYGGHLGFSIFDQEPLERRFGSWHIWNQHTRKPLYANFHAFLTKCTPISHIRPTISYRYTLFRYSLDRYGTACVHTCSGTVRIHLSTSHYKLSDPNCIVTVCCGTGPT